MKKSKRIFKRWEKTIKNDYDWDHVFIFILEREKLKHMLKYWEDYWKDVVKGSKFCDEYKVKTCSVISELKTCITLLSYLIDEKHCVWECKGPGYHTEKIPGKELWELKSNDPNSPGTCTRVGRVNLKNAKRFIGELRYRRIMDNIEKHNSTRGYPNHISCSLENEVYLIKARYLYHKIRFEKEETWWI